MSCRFPITAAALLLASPAGAEGPTRKQVACMLGLNAAGARVATASALAATRCVRDACRGKLGESVDACLSADRGGAIGRAPQRTVIVRTRKCKQGPPFGPQNAQEGNDALAGVVRSKAGV